MPVIKGGVWTNIEDEILKASVSKYGLNQWARVSSLLARKTPKQCKARWAEWLDPGIRKVEWSKDEDEKLLHLAKLMPTQWRTIAPIVGRTATQCLERYQKLLDDAEARENDEEFGLGGPTGGEGAAPSADDVRRLRPGELDPDPESKPARPDTIDLDEDEKEMLSEARARLANTQGKKAKRKARERQLEESRRLALLQKRRELKASGINIKVGTRKKGQMDYNADIPFEKAPAPGFYDTQEEAEKNEAQRAGFDPRKQQLAIKRKGDNDDQELPGKRQKKDKDSGSSAFAAAARAGQLAKLREAEQSSKRRALVLPAPQVSDAEMDDIVKLGLLGRRMDVSEEDDESSRGLRGEYSNRIGATPIRTPRAPQEEDRILNEIRNAKARTQLQSALLGGESADIQEDNTTGYQGATPAHNNLVTPNPLATPYRQGLGPGSTPMRGPGATPMRTPRDTFRLNQDSNTGQLVSQTPRDVRLREQTLRNDLRSKLASLPKPKETEWEFELPDEQTQTPLTSELTTQEDAAVRDERERQQKHAQALLDLRRQTQVIQRGLPRPVYINDTRLLQSASKINDPVKRQVTEVAISLMLHDAENSNKNNKKRSRASIKYLSEEEQYAAKMEITLELAKEKDDVRRASMEKFGEEWDRLHSTRILPGLADYDDDDDEIDEDSLTRIEINKVQKSLETIALTSNALEQKLQKIHGGYISRSKLLRGKILEAADFLAKTRVDIDVARLAGLMEESALRSRLERLRDEVEAVSRKERECQEEWKAVQI